MFQVQDAGPTRFGSGAALIFLTLPSSEMLPVEGSVKLQLLLYD